MINEKELTNLIKQLKCIINNEPVEDDLKLTNAASKELQSTIDELAAELSQPEVAADFQQVIELTAQLQKLNDSIEEMELEWLELSE